MEDKVTKDMTVIEVIRMDPNSAEVFYKHGLHCIGCPSASGESLEDASAVHGIDADKMLDDLNKYFNR